MDEWGAVFTNLQDGTIGEVREPAIIDWDDLAGVRFPRELLSVDLEQVNAFCAESERFVLSPVIARPFERMQFLRKTQNLYIDLIERPPAIQPPPHTQGEEFLAGHSSCGSDNRPGVLTLWWTVVLPVHQEDADESKIIFCSNCMCSTPIPQQPPMICTLR